MAHPKRYSSLPLVLSASGAILVCVAGGWLLLSESPSAEPALDEANQAAALPSPLSADGAVVPSGDVDEAPASMPRTDDDVTIDVDSELRRARLAAGAEMLVSPEGQNAVYFYGRALSADPDHVAANEGLDAVLSHVALDVSDSLAAGDLQGAFDIAVVVAQYRPDHPLVTVTRQTIDQRALQLAELASSAAESGGDAGANDALEALAALPGMNPQFVDDTRRSIDAIRESRDAAERDRLETERLAAQQAVDDWSNKVRGAIKSGQLVSPVGESARDYLAERESPKEKTDELTDELVAALLDASAQLAEAGDAFEAETLIAAAADLRPEIEGLDELRERVELKIIEIEGSRVLGLNDFVRLNTTPARYPRVANQRNLTGWVDVIFTVTQTGATSEIEIVQAEPATIFDRSAIEAVEQWTFQPREFRGRLIDQRASARLVFRLE